MEASSPQSYAGPDDVPCDICTTGRKRKAGKTCMTCMISYCEAHLQPHKEHGVYKRHKLEEPTGNIEEKLCAKHQRVLEIFCRTDESCVCLLCATTEHKTHDTVTPEEEQTGKQNQLGKRRAKIKERIEEKEKKLEEVKETVVRIKSSTEIELQEHEKTFKAVLESIERLRSEVIELIRDYEQKEVSKAEEFIKLLEREIEALKKRNTELDKLSQTNDPIYFLQKFPNTYIPSEDGDSLDIRVDDSLLPETLRKDLSDLQRSLEEISSWKFVKIKGVDTPGYILQNFRMRDQFLKYSCPLTLDPNTIHKRLHLADGNKQVMHKKTETPYPAHPDRFDYWPQVLCSEPLNGTRHYWEVEWSGDGGKIGVTYKGIGRKGKNEEFFLGCNDKSWCLVCSNSQCYVSHNGKNITICTLPSNKIGIYLDYSGGSLSFYSITNKMSLLYKFTVSFTEPLYPGFWVGRNASMKICQLNPSDQ
ncbi:tripartite motif-containing protein 16-like isoform X3 [Erpetoichthys calabaricus]|uniref:tripartite motif-containing protein 16-like isoform X3 n=1 Tax=Erpetoichthys calabaricus TaxID=27687 RepID=UPI0022349425|nr:tripartite motif-containing protein 16-like isoform X3 [Erpetoichthys calabaricus]